MFKNVIIICCIAVILTDCEYLPHATVVIVNNSDEDILWIRSAKVTDEWYEISSIDSWLEREDGKYVVLSKNSSFDRFNSDGVKSNLEKGWFKYTLFNLDSVKTIPWQRICDERIILKEVRFDTWEDFERCNFEITYP